jgi:COP9 signalosome complex subunit 2
VILGIIRPYTRIRMDYLAKQLRIPHDELLRLLIEIIQDGKCGLKIDQTNGYLSKPVDEFQSIEKDRYNAFSNMTRQLEGLRVSMADKIS